MSFRQHVISVSYDGDAAKSFDTALKNAGLRVSRLHSLETAFIVIGHQNYAAVITHPCIPQEDAAILSVLARWRSQQHRIVALHMFPFEVSSADIDLCVLDDPTTIVNCISDLIGEKLGKLHARRSN
jgi:DNA-binding NtrC family response regulator